MGLLFESGDIDILEPVLEEKSEFRLETEVYLPDYLPDIQKILRSEIIPRVASRDMLAGRITVEGEAEIRVFYKSANDEISCAVAVKEFTHTVAVSEPDADYDVSTNTTAGINSVRASGPRKIAVKAEVSTVIVAARNSVIQAAENVSDGVEARRENITLISNAESAEGEMRVTEELELPETMPEIRSLLYADAAVKVKDVVPSAGRCVIKGELTVKPVYISEDGALHKGEFGFPVNRILDLPNIDDKYICDGEMQIVSVYAEPDKNSSGSSRVIDCEIVVNALLHAYKLNDCNIITDVYAPGKMLSEGYAEAKCLTCYDFYRDEKEIRGQIETENGILKVVDVNAEPRIMRVTAEEGCLKAEGIVNADMVYNSESGLSSKKAELPFEFSFPYSCELDARCDTEVAVDSVGYNISGDNTLDLRAVVSIKASVCAERKVRAVNDITVTGDNPTCARCPVILYYAEKGESAWEIAKKYGASVNVIIEENALSGDLITEPAMLMIPLKQ